MSPLISQIAGLSGRGYGELAYVYEPPSPPPPPPPPPGGGGGGGVPPGDGGGGSNPYGPPVITSFTPVSGVIGDLVTITGYNFSPATIVRFSGISASFTILSNTSITAYVPTGAVTGLISVTSPYGIGTSATNFTIVGPAGVFPIYLPSGSGYITGLGAPTTNPIYTVNNGYVNMSIGYKGALGYGDNGVGLMFDSSGSGSYGNFDWIRPGTSWEGYGFNLGSNFVYGNTEGFTDSYLPSTVLGWVVTPGQHYVFVRGSQSKGWVVIQYKIPPGYTAVLIHQLYYNTTESTVAVQSSRAIDPDVDYYPYSTYYTYNYQGWGGIPTNKIVLAAGPSSGKVLALYTLDAVHATQTSSRAPWSLNPRDTLLFPAFISYSDSDLELAADFTTIASGAYAYYSCYYIYAPTLSSLTPTINTLIDAGLLSALDNGGGTGAPLPPPSEPPVVTQTTYSPAGEVGSLVGGSAGADDASFEIQLPYTIYFNGTGYSVIYVSSNSFVTFGTSAGSLIPSTSLTSPGSDKIRINSGDRRSVRILYQNTGTSWRIRYVGMRYYTYAFPYTEDIIWELSSSIGTPNLLKLDIVSLTMGTYAAGGIDVSSAGGTLFSTLGGAGTSWNIQS